MAEFDDLPNDIEALKALVLEQGAQLNSRIAEIEHLKLLIAKLKRMQFGRSSERLDRQVEQLELQLEELQSHQAQVAATVKPNAHEKRQPVRRPLPEHLPRERVVHEPACSCPDCGAAMRKIGEDVSEVLDYVPARFRVIRHVRPKMACTACERIVQVDAPSRPIERGIAGPGLLAHVLTSKYADHLPLYRQAQIYAREGVELERSTMAEWVGGCFQLVNPLIEALARYVLGANKLHADDTPVPVLEPGRGKTKTGRLWTYVRDDRPATSTEAAAVLFRFSPDRRGKHPRAHLAQFSGILQADAYPGYDALYKTGRIIEVGCWAHYLERRFIWSRVPLASSFPRLRLVHGTRHNSWRGVEGHRRVGERRCRFRCIRGRLLKRISPHASGVLLVYPRAPCIRRVAAPSLAMAAMAV